MIFIFGKDTLWQARFQALNHTMQMVWHLCFLFQTYVLRSQENGKPDSEDFWGESQGLTAWFGAPSVARCCNFCFNVLSAAPCKRKELERRKTGLFMPDEDMVALFTLNHTLNQINFLSNLHAVHAPKLGLNTEVQPSIGDDPIMFPISQLHHPHNHYHIPHILQIQPTLQPSFGSSQTHPQPPPSGHKPRPSKKHRNSPPKPLTQSKGKSAMQ